MITYDYKCNKCGEVREISIETIDICSYKDDPSKRGKYKKSGALYAVDKEELTKRIYEKRECECGGELKRVWSEIKDPMFITYHKQRIM